jgi:hypothetical protein
MASDYTEYDTLNAVGIVRACLAANRPERIISALLDHRSAASVEAELAETARPPERTAARAPTSAPATSDAFAAAIEKRFRSQNARRS